jgi:hypothetical protein
MDKRLTFAVVIIGIVIVSQSGCTPPTELERALPPSLTQYPAYNFTYQLTASDKKGDLTIALIAPSFVISGIQTSTAMPSYGSLLLRRDVSPDVADYIDKLIKAFLSSLESDFEKVLIADGYRTIGPFSDRERMTYPEKEQADFSLEPRISIELLDEITRTTPPERVEVKTRVTKVSPRRRNAPTEDEDFPYGVRKDVEIHPGMVSGTLTVGARVELHLYEPLTSEKMWIKSLSLPNLARDQYTYKFNDVNGQRVVGEDERPKILSNVLSRSYKQILDEFHTYFDAKELKQLNLKAKEIREKKRF